MKQAATTSEHIFWLSQLLQSLQGKTASTICINNYFTFLDLWGVFLFPLEKYLIMSRLKYG
jgi:hypothetical protein